MPGSVGRDAVISNRHACPISTPEPIELEVEAFECNP
jgi:hypothetical protein